MVFCRYGRIESLDIRAVERTFDDICHTSVCELRSLRAEFCRGDAEFGHLLRCHHALEVVFRHHIIGITQLYEIVLKSLVELEVILPCRDIVEVEITLRAIECDRMLLNEVTLTCHISDDCDFLTIEIELDEIVGRAVSGLSETFNGRFNHYGNRHFLALSIGSFLSMIGETCRAIDADTFSCHIETCTHALIEALHQDCIIIHEVLCSESKLNSHAVTLDRGRLEWLVIECGGHIFGYSESLFTEE